METFGDLLSQLRFGAGLSLRELGRRCGVSEGYLSDLERGRRRPPPLPLILLLARALGADPFPLALRAAAERGVVEIPLRPGLDPEVAVRLALHLLREDRHGPSADKEGRPAHFAPGAQLS